MRVLVADDDSHIVKMFEFMLSMEGYEVVTAANGGEALDQIRRQAPDVVLLDVMMPFVDGLQVAKCMRDDRLLSRIPVIMITAKAGDEDMWAGWERGVSSYLTKPVDPDVLLAEIRRVTYKDLHVAV